MSRNKISIPLYYREGPHVSPLAPKHATYDYCVLTIVRINQAVDPVLGTFVFISDVSTPSTLGYLPRVNSAICPVQLGDYTAKCPPRGQASTPVLAVIFSYFPRRQLGYITCELCVRPGQLCYLPR